MNDFGVKQYLDIIERLEQQVQQLTEELARVQGQRCVYCGSTDKAVRLSYAAIICESDWHAPGGNP